MKIILANSTPQGNVKPFHEKIKLNNTCTISECHSEIALSMVL